MTHEDIVMKLIGPVSPIGETNEDNLRFENLKKLINLTYTLLETIHDVSKNKDAHAFSVKRSGLKASQFFRDLNEEYHKS